MESHRFSFTGNGKEYFKIWIVNILLTIVTLGIYSAWATVRNKRYFYGNTWFADANFEYHATPKQILFGRIIAIALLIAYIALNQITPILGFALMILLVLGTPWIVWRSMQFNSRMSSYRNVRFQFSGTLKQAYKLLLWIPMLPVLIAGGLSLVIYLLIGEAGAPSIGLLVGLAFMAIYMMIPFLHNLLDSYHINHSQFGQGQFAAELDVGEYYVIYLKWIGLSMLAGIGIFAVVALVIAVFAGGAAAMFGGDAEASETAIMAMIVPMIIGIYVPIIMLGMLLNAYLKSRIRNYSFGETKMDGEVLDLTSDVKARDLFKIYLTNALMIVFSFGLATPWAKVRLARYTAEHTQGDVTGNLAQYVGQQQNLQTSLGDEMGDAFDVQAGIEVGL